MRQKSFFFVLSIVIIFIYIQPVYAENILDLNIVQTSQLSERKSIWPNWRVPSFLKRPRLKDDLIYPDWFEGTWDVTSNIEGDKMKNLLFILQNSNMTLLEN